MALKAAVNHSSPGDDGPEPTTVFATRIPAELQVLTGWHHQLWIPYTVDRTTKASVTRGTREAIPANTYSEIMQPVLKLDRRRRQSDLEGTGLGVWGFGFTLDALSGGDVVHKRQLTQPAAFDIVLCSILPR